MAHLYVVGWHGHGPYYNWNNHRVMFFFHLCTFGDLYVFFCLHHVISQQSVEVWGFFSWTSASDEGQQLPLAPLGSKHQWFPSGFQPTNGKPTNGKPTNGKPSNGKPSNGKLVNQPMVSQWFPRKMTNYAMDEINDEMLGLSHGNIFYERVLIWRMFNNLWLLTGTV